MIIPFTIAFALTVLAVCFQALDDPGLSTFWHRTIAEQGGRDSPFSVWGQDHSLGWLQTVVKAAVVGLARWSHSGRDGVTSSRSLRSALP